MTTKLTAKTVGYQSKGFGRGDQKCKKSINGHLSGKTFPRGVW
jgi:hypothetical protein